MLVRNNRVKNYFLDLVRLTNTNFFLAASRGVGRGSHSGRGGRGSRGGRRGDDDIDDGKILLIKFIEILLF